MARKQKETIEVKFFGDPLLLALFNRDWRIACSLLTGGFKIDPETVYIDESGTENTFATALARMHDDETALLFDTFLEHGVDFTARTKDFDWERTETKKTPFEIAINNQNPKTAMRIAALLPKGYEVSKETIHAAASHGYNDCLSFMAATGCDIDIRDDSGETPLMQVSDIRTFKTLVDLGADVSATDDKNLSVRDHLALRCSAATRDAAFAIIKEKAGETESDKLSSITAMTRAGMQRNFIIREIRQNGVSATDADKNGETILDVAITHDRWDIILTLSKEWGPDIEMQGRPMWYWLCRPWEKNDRYTSRGRHFGKIDDCRRLIPEMHPDRNEVFRTLNDFLCEMRSDPEFRDYSIDWSSLAKVVGTLAPFSSEEQDQIADLTKTVFGRENHQINLFSEVLLLDIKFGSHLFSDEELLELANKTTDSAKKWNVNGTPDHGKVLHRVFGEMLRINGNFPNALTYLNNMDSSGKGHTIFTKPDLQEIMRSDNETNKLRAKASNSPQTRRNETFL